LAFASSAIRSTRAPGEAVAGELSGGRLQEAALGAGGVIHTDVTHSYEWRIDQLDRLERMIAENHERFNQALAQDFKTAWFEQEMEFGGAMSAIFEHSADWAPPAWAAITERPASTR
jgi:hypothetical protein